MVLFIVFTFSFQIKTNFRAMLYTWLVLPPFLLPIGQLPYPSTHQWSLPTYSNTAAYSSLPHTYPGQSVCPQQSFGPPVSTCSWDLGCCQDHCAAKLGKQETWSWGQRFGSYVIRTDQHIRMWYPMSLLPAMLSGTFPFLQRPGSHKALETELGLVVNGIKGKGLWRPQEPAERPPWLQGSLCVSIKGIQPQLPHCLSRFGVLWTCSILVTL